MLLLLPTLLTILTPALAITFSPAPTTLEPNLHGFTPKPTTPALLRRQKDPALCGYLRGESDAPVSCSVGSCLYDDKLSWFGCCTGTARSDCQISTTCVGSASASSCLANSKCAGDEFALACTAATAGVCMTMVREVEEGSVSHFVCGSSSRSVQVFATATDGGVSASSRSASVGSGSSGRTVSSSRTVSSGSSSRSSQVTSSESSSQTSTSQTSSTRSSTSDAPRVNSAATSTRPTSTLSTAGAVKTAQVVLGAVALAGVVAWVPV